MGDPLISVIIPCYRQAEYLPATLDCLLGQSFRDIEIVVVNDGSDDDTEAVAARYAGRIRYVWQPNQGLAAARNTGIAHAKGKYLLFLDSDDRLHPDALAWLVEAAAGREQVLCVMGWQAFQCDDDLTSGFWKLPPRGVPLGPALMLVNFSPPHGYLSCREMVQQLGGFDASVPGCEDWDLWLRLLFAGAEVVPVYRVGAYYRQHLQSMSRNLVKMALAAAGVLRRALQRIKMNPEFVTRLGGSPEESQTAVRRRMTQELLDAAFHQRQQGAYLGAFRTYLRSLFQGSITLEAVLGMAKLLPHRLFRRWVSVRSVGRITLLESAPLQDASHLVDPGAPALSGAALCGVGPAGLADLSGSHNRLEMAGSVTIGSRELPVSAGAASPPVGQ